MALALAANVSPRQLSFIETGRGRPTAATLDRLADALSITRRERALLMQAATATDPHAGPLADPTFARSVERSLAFLLEQQEPWPAWVIDRYTNVRMRNRAMDRLLPLLLSPGHASENGQLNMIRIMFDSEALRLRVANWQVLARTAFQRLQLAVVADPHDREMRALYDYVLACEPSAAAWARKPPAQPLDLVVPLTLRTNGPEIRLATAFTMLATPDGVTIQDFYVQTFFPTDEFSRQFLRSLAANEEATEESAVRSGC